MGRDDNSSNEELDEDQLPSTPKRARIAPEVLPLGLERSDFHTLQDSSNTSEAGKPEGTEVEVEADGPVVVRSFKTNVVGTSGLAVAAKEAAVELCRRGRLP